MISSGSESFSSTTAIRRYYILCSDIDSSITTGERAPNVSGPVLPSAGSLPHVNSFHCCYKPPSTIPCPSCFPCFQSHSLSFSTGKLTEMNSYKALTMRRLAAQRANSKKMVPRARSTFVATDLPRPPPKAMPDPVEFSSVSKPGVYYERPRFKRDLPAAEVRVYSDNNPRNAEHTI